MKSERTVGFGWDARSLAMFESMARPSRGTGKPFPHVTFGGLYARPKGPQSETRPGGQRFRQALIPFVTNCSLHARGMPDGPSYCPRRRLGGSQPPPDVFSGIRADSGAP